MPYDRPMFATLHGAYPQAGRRPRPIRPRLDRAVARGPRSAGRGRPDPADRRRPATAGPRPGDGRRPGRDRTAGPARPAARVISLPAWERPGLVADWRADGRADRPAGQGSAGRAVHASAGGSQRGGFDRRRLTLALARRPEPGAGGAGRGRLPLRPGRGGRGGPRSDRTRPSGRCSGKPRLASSTACRTPARASTGAWRSAAAMPTWPARRPSSRRPTRATSST